MCGAAIVQGALGFGQNFAAQNAQIAQQRADYASQLARNEIEKRQQEDIAQTRAKEAILHFQQLQLAEQEANAAATEQKSQTARELMRARSLVKASAAGAGISGNVVDRAMVDMGFTEGQKMAAIETSRVSAIDQAENEKIAANLRAQMQPVYTTIGEVPRFGGKNFLAAALSGLGGFVGNGGFDFLNRKSTQKVSETASTTTSTVPRIKPSDFS